MKYLLFLLFPLSVFSGKTYQIEFNLRSYLDSLPLKNIEVKLFEDHKLVHKQLSNEHGMVVFQGLRSKKYKFEVVGDTTSFELFSGSIINKKRSDCTRDIYLNPTEKIFIEHCEKIVDRYFENGGFMLSVDTINNCVSEIDSEPIFPGGQMNLSFFISRFLHYPAESVELGEQGKVYLSFMVEPDGVISNVHIIRGVSELLDREALSIMDRMPRWIPAVCNGKRVRSKMLIPLKFALV